MLSNDLARRVIAVSIMVLLLFSSAGYSGVVCAMSQSSVQSKGERQLDSPDLETFLRKGKLQDAETELCAWLKNNPSDDERRFGLGLLQFMRAVEKLVQDLHRFGLRDASSRGLGLPFSRLPVPPNTKPEKLNYEKAQESVRTFVDNLAKAEKTLSEVQDADTELKLPVHFGLIRLDLNGDGKATEEESLWRIYSALSNRNLSEETAENFYICFDRGDLHWLKGYCHLIMAFMEIYLAYDTKEMFECTAHLFFPSIETRYEFLSKGKHVRRLANSDLEILDLIAFIHLISWELKDSKHMHAALSHFEGMVSESKKMWKCIMAETDDDHEWIPNPKQTGVIPGVKVTEEMVTAWTSLMDKIEKILKGELLISFWRREDGNQGINLRRVFLEPRKLDLVLWVQGSAAAPYLENGPCTKIETWRELQRSFGSQFPGFAIWFN